MMQKQARLEQDWRQLGHGKYVLLLLCIIAFVLKLTYKNIYNEYNRYSEVTDTKEFFNICKKSQRVIVHFYRSVTPRCEIVDSHFEILANNHVETRFIKIDAEKSPYLVEKLGIILIPTMVIIINGKTNHSIRGFDEFGGIDEFTTSDMAHVLAGHEAIKYEGDRSEEIAKSSSIAGLNHVNIKGVQNSIYSNKNSLSDDEDDFDDV